MTLLGTFAILFTMLTLSTSQFVGLTHVAVHVNNDTVEVFVMSPTRYGYLCVGVASDNFPLQKNYGIWLENDNFPKVAQLRDGTMNITTNYLQSVQNDTILIETTRSLEEYFKGVRYRLEFNVTSEIYANWNVSLAWNEFKLPIGDFNISNLEFHAKHANVTPGGILPISTIPLIVELWSLPSWIVALCFYSGSLVLLILLIGRHPLRSRGIMPYFGGLVIVFHELHGVAILLDFETSFRFSDVYATCKVAAYSALALTGALSYARFVGFNFLKHRKVNIAKAGAESGKTTTICTPIIILKLFGSSWFVGPMIVVDFVIIMILAWLIWLYLPQISPFLIATMSYCAVGVFFGMTLLFDVITSLMTIRRDGFWKFWKDDNYYYRREVIFGLIGLGFMFCDIIMLVDYGNRGKNYIALCIVNSLTYFFIWVYLCGFIIIVTIWNIVLRVCCKRKKVQTGKDLVSLLEIPVVRELFADFCAIEYSIENLSFYDSVMLFKTETSKVRKEELSKQIHALYLNGSRSELEVNLPGGVASHITREIQSGLISDNLFDSALDAIKTNLHDTFSRFRFSAEFMKWEEQYKLMQQSLGNAH